MKTATTTTKKVIDPKIKKIAPEYLSVWNKYVADPDDQNVDGYASHQPALIKVLQRFKNPSVIELGTGRGSSAIVARLSGYSEHYETDANWYNEMKELFESKNHPFILVTNFDKFNWYECDGFNKKWDVGFVDSAPGESRQSSLMKLKDKCHFIVCHDTEEVYKPAASDYKWDFKGFKYHFVFKNYNTYTTVVSDLEQFEM